MLDRLASIPVEVKETNVRLFSDAGRATESIPDTKDLAVMRTVVNRSVTMTSQSSTFQAAVEIIVQICLAEPQAAIEVEIHTIHLLALTLPAGKFVRNKAEKRFLEKTEMNPYQSVSYKTAADHKKKAEDESLLQNMDWVRSPSPSTDISHDKRMNPKAYSNFMSSEQSDIQRDHRRRQAIRSRSERSHQDYRSPMPPVSKQDVSKSGLKNLLPFNENYEKAADYCSYRLIHKHQKYDDKVTYEIQKMHKMSLAKYRTSSVTEMTRSQSSLLSLKSSEPAVPRAFTKDVTTWLFYELMKDFALPTVRTQLNLSSNDKSTYDGTIKTYAEVMSHSLSRYAIDAVIVKGNEKRDNFKQRSLPPCDFFQRLWNLILRCGCV